MKNKGLAITPGDPKGIGPEVTQKALFRLQHQLKNVEIKIYSTPFRVPKKLNISFIPPFIKKGQKTGVGLAIKEAFDYVQQFPDRRAMVTGPISKTLLQKEGYHFVGHTDFLASLANKKQVTMVLANEYFKVSLVTSHCPLSKVSQKITREAVIKTILDSAEFCKNFLGKKNVKIAVLGLNPHAGEAGLLGDEEIKTIIPAMKSAAKISKKMGVNLNLTGPHPSDSFFTIEKSEKIKKKRHDFIIAQYHDQGLIPVKLSDFKNAMNLTLGLPIIRTSVDHGTAYDIAGKNKADPSSMVYAIQKALEYL